MIRTNQQHPIIFSLISLLVAFTLVTMLPNPVKALPSNIEDLVLSWVQGNSDQEFIGKGGLGGCFTDEEFWKIYRILHHEYPKKVGDLIRFGQSFENRHIHGFFLQSNRGILKFFN